MNTQVRIAQLAVGMILLSGCATLPNGSRWGEHATMRPPWPRVRRAAARAASSPGTWLPLAGAAVIQIDEMDERLSDWARKETPVFGSTEAANDASVLIHTIADVGLVGSIFAAPSGGEPAPWAVSKVKGGGVELSALVFSSELITATKQKSERVRPNGQNDRSFPSRHVAEVSLESTFAYHNLSSIGLPKPAKTALAAGFTGLSVADGWARVEEGAHYPSDVLVGLGLGHFFARFFQEAFLCLDEEKVSIDVSPMEDGIAFSVTVTF